MLWPSWVKFWNTSNQLDHTRCESFIHLKRTNDLPHAFIRVNFTVHSQFTLKYLLLHYHPVNFSFYLLLVHPTTFNFYSVRDSFNLLYSYFFFQFSAHYIFAVFFPISLSGASFIYLWNTSYDLFCNTSSLCSCMVYMLFTQYNRNRYIRSLVTFLHVSLTNLTLWAVS